MSETVHHKGTLTKIVQPEDKSLIEVAKDIMKERGFTEMPPYCVDALEWLMDDLGNEFFYHPKTQTLYKVEDDVLPVEMEIIEADKNPDGTIKYHLMFYNGGASFGECLEEALNKLEDN